ncbi:reverse transcriptase, putative [Talaromyces stipitatus ATCC 10500]|uniref:Reverse transcriptase, putative n=1 Tax=Talaromyces stipitatus (strain ATCC 10500 / CBS 375.48 / QM 6759 / NRRL 1006) TaxID=441959 RepID=B8MNA5_TALSN|nr:reverse transcriptase, putative [Talaromyces stipitatus ATCC 10500]EED14554.1 reverse transcriptase, putative [Talaromyces stipitatus ATCC 10500]
MLVTKNKAKAKVFLEAFFPEMAEPEDKDIAIPSEKIPWHLITELEIHWSLKAAKGTTALGEDRIITLFGGQPGRNTEQALLVLANAIDRAWLQSKVIMLIAFNLKGAFNGVNISSLDARLQAKGIPVIARHWIRSFMESRYASISFDDFQTEISSLEHAGLAQGSPLSPILFGFFNSDLVDQPVDHHGGASAFIDDYFRWRAGPSAEDNVRKI